MYVPILPAKFMGVPNYPSQITLPNYPKFMGVPNYVPNYDPKFMGVPNYGHELDKAKSLPSNPILGILTP